MCVELKIVLVWWIMWLMIISVIVCLGQCYVLDVVVQSVVEVFVQDEIFGICFDFKMFFVVEFYFLVCFQVVGVMEGLFEFEFLVDVWFLVQEQVGVFGGYWWFDLVGFFVDLFEEFVVWFVDVLEVELICLG